MGFLNRMMLFLILLAAAGSAVLSYFLFEKRTEMLKGWQLMANQINTTAQKMDQGSGTKVADEIKTKDFTHRDLSAMETRLKKLSAAAAQLVKQRDALAQTVCIVAQEASGETFDQAELLKLDTYEEYQKMIVSKVKGKVQAEKAKKREIVANFAKVGEPLGLYRTPTQINGDNGSSLVTAVRNAVAQKNRIISEANVSFRTVSKSVSVSHTDNKFKATSEAIYKKVVELRKAVTAAENRRNIAEREAAKHIKLYTRLYGVNAALVADIAVLQEEIRTLKTKLNPTNDANIARMEYHAKTEADYLSLFKKVKREVKSVDSKWNFVVIDLGAKEVVYENFSGKVYKTVLDITPGKTMTIVRNLDSGKRKIVAKVVIKEVYDDHSIADIVTSSVHDKIQEGDFVVFLDDDLELIKEDIQKLLKGTKK